MAIETEAEFTEVYQTNYADLLRFVRRRAHPLNVDDIVGETFLVAWRRRRDLPSDIRPWLFRTARNAMLNSTRGSNRQTAVAVRIAQSEPWGTRDGLSDVEHRVDLAQAWGMLTSPDQEALALTIWEDLSAKDAAAVLGCSRAAYAMRLTRAKRHLAALLDAPAPLNTQLATS
ncbi:MAG TPA: sigma-70 family RNA polymerase sigma factor [Galbitalea sp.]|jgi:RNA polymerase sigma-70 factor (ECF subfamily)